MPTYLLAPGLQSIHKWTGDLNLAGRLDGQWRIVFLTPAEERPQREKEVLRRSKTPTLTNIPTASKSSDVPSQLLFSFGNGGAGRLRGKGSSENQGSALDSPPTSLSDCCLKAPAVSAGKVQGVDLLSSSWKMESR